MATALMCRCTLLLCILATRSLAQNVVICPSRDYERDQTGLFCYRYVQTPSDYFAANRTCTQERGAIVYIESSQENDYISQTYFTGRAGLEFWIGINDIANEGTFRWTNLSVSVTYENWVGMNPTVTNRGDHDCVKFTNASQWAVHNGACSTSHLPFLCKMHTCIQSPLLDGVCVGEEPVLGVSAEIIAIVVVVVIVVAIVLVLLVMCVLVWKFNNEAFQRYFCCCVSGKSKSTVHSLQQENERLRKQLSEHRVSVSGRFSHAELSGVPDGRGGVLPTIKQVPSIPEDRPVSFARGRPPPLTLQRPSSQVTPVNRGLPTPTSTVPTPLFLAGQRPTRQSAPGFLHSQGKKPFQTPLKKIKDQEDSESSDEEFFAKEEGVPDPRAKKPPLPVAEKAPLPVAEKAPLPVAEKAPLPVAEKAPLPVAEKPVDKSPSDGELETIH